MNIWKKSVSTAMVVAASLLSDVHGAEPANVQQLIAELQNEDRSICLSVLSRIDGHSMASEALAEAVLNLARREIIATVQPSIRRNADKKPVKFVPLTGEELSLTRLQANPSDYVSRPFILCGAVQVSNYFSGGYSDAEDSHYSLRFTEIDKDGELGSGSAELFLLKPIGTALVESIVQNQEAGFTHVLFRFRCTIDPARYEGVSSWNHIEVLDWQSVSDDSQSWKPWKYELVNECKRILSEMGKPTVNPCIRVLSGEPVEPAIADALMQEIVFQVLQSLDIKSRRMAVTRISRELRKSKKDSVVQERLKHGQARLSVAAARPQ